MNAQDGLDTSRPNAARVLDVLLCGKDNFASDRELAAALEKADPDARRRAAENRAFILAAVRRAAGAGVAQFLDLAAGFPSGPSVHEAAREINPGARVAYVDRDPVVLAHAAALLAGPGLAASGADPENPAQVLSDPAVLSVINPAEPVGVILGVTLHFLDADTARKVCGGYIGAMAPGSWLAASGSCFDDAELLERVKKVFTPARVSPHSPKVFRSFFAGTQIVEPGITSAPRWTRWSEVPWTRGQGAEGLPCREAAYVIAAAGVKE